MKILVVDDEPTITAVVSEILSDTHVVSMAASSKEALALLDVEHFDIVLTDFNMPGMDGSALSHVIHCKHVQTKVIIFTGSDDIDAIKTQSGVEHVLRKPLNWKILFSVLESYEKEIES